MQLQSLLGLSLILFHSVNAFLAGVGVNGQAATPLLPSSSTTLIDSSLSIVSSVVGAVSQFVAVGPTPRRTALVWVDLKKRHACARCPVPYLFWRGATAAEVWDWKAGKSRSCLV